MKVSNKKGITITSIVVYVILFFMFTTVTTIISSGFNEDLFNDRGMAINITAINKLEYNLLKSASDSYMVSESIDGNKKTVTFSNADVYIFDLDENVVYKNGGKLIKYVEACEVNLTNNVMKVDIAVNKYINKIERIIKINVPMWEV